MNKEPLERFAALISENLRGWAIRHLELLERNHYLASSWKPRVGASDELSLADTEDLVGRVFRKWAAQDSRLISDAEVQKGTGIET